MAKKSLYSQDDYLNMIRLGAVNPTTRTEVARLASKKSGFALKALEALMNMNIYVGEDKFADDIIAYGLGGLITQNTAKSLYEMAHSSNSDAPQKIRELSETLDDGTDASIRKGILLACVEALLYRDLIGIYSELAFELRDAASAFDCDGWLPGNVVKLMRGDF